MGGDTHFDADRHSKSLVVPYQGSENRGSGNI